MARMSTQVRFDETLYEKVKVIAENEVRSVNAQIEYFIKKGIEAYEAENGTIILMDEE